MTDSLDNARRELDKIDSEIAKLYEKRMHVISQVAQIKKQAGLPTYDKSREADMKIKRVNGLDDQSLAPYYPEVLDAFLSASKKYQEDLKNK